MGWFGDMVMYLTDPESWSGNRGIPVLLFQHLAYTAAALGLACLIGLPLAVWLGHIGRGGVLAVQISNIGRAVPTLAILVIFVLLPAPFGLTPFSAVVAFTVFALPAIVTNAYVGMREVDRGTVDAARGMGMTGTQVLRRVELPLATPLIMNGVRLAAVQLVATVALAAIAGFGGLGRIVTRGYANQDVGTIVAGSLLIALLAIATELLFELVGRRVDPTRRAMAASRERSGGQAAADRSDAAVVGA